MHFAMSFESFRAGFPIVRAGMPAQSGTWRQRGCQAPIQVVAARRFEPTLKGFGTWLFFVFPI